MGFYKNALIGFGIQLIILLAIMAVVLSNQSNSQSFPANVSACPDFYSMSNDDGCTMMQSFYSSREPGCKDIYPNKLSALDKKLWASNCGVAWDGITNSSII
jgi:hypothetical protein